MSNELKERAQMDEKYLWHLQDIYESGDAFEKDLESCRALLKDMAAWKGRVKTDPMGAVRAYFDGMKRFTKLYSYAFMKQDEDGGNTEAQARSSRTMSLIVQAQSASAYLEPELLEMDAEALKALIDDPANSDYSVYLSEILRRKPHTLSAAEEQLLSSAGEVLGAPREIFSMFDDVDAPFPEVTREDGESMVLSHAGYGVLIRSKDERVRREAYEAMMGTFAKFASTITAMYAGHVKADMFTMQARKYATCREMAMDASQIPVAVYDSLIEAMHKALPSLAKALQIRKARLGLEKMHLWDLYAPIMDDFDLDMDYETAYQTVIKALSPLGKDYTDLLQKAHDEGWIDVYPNKNKRSGAYSSSCYGVHPYVLLNQTDDLESCSTIAHEMGHALHTWHSEQTQPYPKADYSLFVAEVASTTNEVLLMRYLMNQYRDDKKATAFLCNQLIEAFRTTVFRQTLFAEFELRAHTLAEQGQALTKESLCAIHRELNETYYGAVCEMDDLIGNEWMRIPHFYSSYYVYVYATGYCAAVAIADRILSEGEEAVKGYKRFLSAGCSVPPIEALKYAGVDMNDPRTVERAMKVFDETVDKLQKALEG